MPNESTIDFAAIGNRRSRGYLQSPVEQRAHDLVWAIEKMGAHPLLTEAQQAASKAHETLVRWHVEGEQGGNPNRYEPTDGDKHHERFVAKSDGLYAALKTAIFHIEHMAAWIGAQNAGYSFEGLGEDMPSLKSALNGSTRPASLEDAARVADHEVVARLAEALTPSGETKYAYSGEFSWTDWRTDEDGVVQGFEMTVPWTTIKEIMVAIAERAGFSPEGIRALAGERADV